MVSKQPPVTKEGSNLHIESTDGFQILNFKSTMFSDSIFYSDVQEHYYLTIKFK